VARELAPARLGNSASFALTTALGDRFDAIAGGANAGNRINDNGRFPSRPLQNINLLTDDDLAEPAYIGEEAD
jgi:hypothetical protein